MSNFKDILPKHFTRLKLDYSIHNFCHGAAKGLLESNSHSLSLISRETGHSCINPVMLFMIDKPKLQN